MRGIRQHGLARSLYEESVDGQAALLSAGYGPEEGRLLGFFPHVSKNPFQRMLYARGFANGFACFPLKSTEDVETLPDDIKLVLHYHWLHHVFAGVSGARAAAKATARFLDRVKRQRDAGHTLVWTVHNMLSHLAAFPEEEKVLRAGMAAEADIVHIMNPKTPDICSKLYELDKARVIASPHPSYCGVYGDYMCRDQARFTLDMSESDRVFLLFGSLGPHKGTRQFLDGVDELQDMLSGRARILIAGQPGKPDFMAEIMERVAGRVDVQLFQAHVDDQAIQMFFKAADVVVCPYPIGLNSGVMVSAASFGRPAVVPQMMAEACMGLEDYVVPYGPASGKGIYQACSKALELADDPDVETALTAWAHDNRPEIASDRFFDALKARL